MANLNPNAEALGYYRQSLRDDQIEILVALNEASALPPSNFRWRFWRWGKRSGALYFEFERGRHLRVQAQFDLMVAQGANRMLEMNLSLVERDIELVLEFVSNCSGSHSAEHLPVL